MAELTAVVFDIEANGFLGTADKLWVFSHTKIIRTTSTTDKVILQPSVSYQDNQDSFERAIEDMLDNCFMLIGHNIIGYDVPLIAQLYPALKSKLYSKRLLDTYTLSKLTYPDRKLPKACPRFVLNELTKKRKTIGPHGLDSWAYRTGSSKPQIDQWEEFEEGMIGRCEEDVINNTKTLYSLLKEAGMSLESLFELDWLSS